MGLVGIGVDVAEVSRFEELLERGGDRFKGRWFTAEEIRECDAQANTAAAYATRFAAKEAVWKALNRSAGQPLAWKQISVVSAGGRPTVRLAGDLAATAAALSVTAISLSMAEAAGAASAVAVVEGGCPCGEVGPTRGSD